LAEEADESATDMHGEVNQKKPIDEELSKNLSLLIGIRGRILALLKRIIGLVKFSPI
jgi:hypothetical protein